MEALLVIWYLSTGFILQFNRFEGEFSMKIALIAFWLPILTVKVIEEYYEFNEDKEKIQ